jgi:hypothetical protein
MEANPAVCACACVSNPPERYVRFLGGARCSLLRHSPSSCPADSSEGVSRAGSGAAESGRLPTDCHGPYASEAPQRAGAAQAPSPPPGHPRRPPLGRQLPPAFAWRAVSTLPSRQGSGCLPGPLAVALRGGHRLRWPGGGRRLEPRRVWQRRAAGVRTRPRRRRLPTHPAWAKTYVLRRVP